LTIGAAGVIPDASNVTLTGGTLALGTFNETVGTVTVNGSTVQITGAGTLTGSSYDLRQSNTTAAQGISAVLGGSGNASKTGANTVLLTAVNTYSGSTTITAGTLSVDGDATLGNGAGTLIMNGGTLNTTASRNNGTAPIANNLSVTADSTIATSGTAATTQLNLTATSITGNGSKLTIKNNGTSVGGVFQVRFSNGFTTSVPMEIASGTNGTTELSSFNGTSTTQQFDGVISGDGSYVRNASTVSGGGTTIFTAANTYTGGTNVSRGTLVAGNTSGSATGTGAVTINNGGTLAGSGAVAGDVTVNSGGSVSPGNSIDSLTLGANLSFIAGGSFVAEIDSSAALSVAADLLNIGGNLSIASGALLNLSDIAATSQVLPDGTKFTLMSYAGTWDLGTFNLAPDGGAVLAGVNSFMIDYDDSTPGLNFPSDTPIGAGISYVTLTVAAVPEPAAFLFGGLACGLVGLGHYGRKYMAKRTVA